MSAVSPRPWWRRILRPTSKLGRLLRALFLLWLAPHILVPLALAITDWPLFRRAVSYGTVNEITDAHWYQPVAEVPGDPRSLPVASTPSIDPEALRAVDAYVAERNSSALVILHQGRLVWQNTYNGFALNQRFNAMSVTKTVVGLLVGIAVHEGHLGSEEDRVAQYVPTWGDQRASITLRHLLQMASGLRRSGSQINPWSDLVQMHMGRDARKVALQVPAETEPGAVFSYNNVNTQVLSHVLEQATGEPIASYLSRTLWRPIGAQPASWWLDRPDGTAKTYCCLLATAHDWAKVGELLVNGGRVGSQQVVPQAWIERMLTPSPVHAHYGLHVWLGGPHPWTDAPRKHPSEPFVAKDTFWLDGRGHQRVYVVPSQKLVVVRVGNYPWDWDEAFIPNTLVRGIVRRAEQSSEQEPF